MLTRDKLNINIRWWRRRWLRDGTAGYERSRRGRPGHSCAAVTVHSWSWPWLEHLAPAAGPSPGHAHCVQHSATASARPATSASLLHSLQLTQIRTYLNILIAECYDKQDHSQSYFYVVIIVKTYNNRGVSSIQKVGVILGPRYT